MQTTFTPQRGQLIEASNNGTTWHIVNYFTTDRAQWKHYLTKTNGKIQSWHYIRPIN